MARSLGKFIKKSFTIERKNLMSDFNDNKGYVAAATEIDYQYWTKTREIIEQLIDIILNYRQSGHPGGSRSKVHMLVSLLLSGIMRWDVRDPGRKFADRFILSAGHTIPLIYSTLAVLNESIYQKGQQSNDSRFSFRIDPKYVLRWEDLLGFRHRGGLSGHAEMEGKTLFLKFSTGASGHGSAAAVGEALALKRAGAKGVKVFAIEGEGGLTPGINHEAMNSAWGLKLDNLFYLLEWNDYGIDDHRLSQIVYGNPEIWFSAHGWRVNGTEDGTDWGAINQNLQKMVFGENLDGAPSVMWTKTRKGQGYLKYDNASHGSPNPMDSEIFWETKKPFAEKYGVEFVNFGKAAPDDPDELKEEFRGNLNAVINVLQDDKALVDYLSERLISISESIPEKIEGFRLGGKGNPFKDERVYDFTSYPEELYAKPGEQKANRAALASWSAWVNSFGAKNYGQPLFLACSADLCDSTNVSGFGNPFGDFEGYGWYERKGTDSGALLPQAITEMVNAGLLTGTASVNFADNLEEEFKGFWGACSTYGSFSYLKYGLFRIFSQLVQSCQWKMGKVLWVVGHSGPETADDSRTHFGIFSPGVTQLFPKGHIINIYPWEFNEVPVLLGAALKQDVPLVALHLTRPNIEIPDRKKLGIPSYFEAAKGAYIVRDYDKNHPKKGTFFVQGTSAMASIIKILPDLASQSLNVKIIYAASPELFDIQPDEYKNKVISQGDKLNSTVITTTAKGLMGNWMFNPYSEKYALSSDWDDRWRTGGTLDEVLDEAHLTPEWILEGMKKFAASQEDRLSALKVELNN
jgi:transketolase